MSVLIIDAGLRGTRMRKGVLCNLLTLRALCDCPAWRGRQDKRVSDCGPAM